MNKHIFSFALFFATRKVLIIIEDYVFYFRSLSLSLRGGRRTINGDDTHIFFLSLPRVFSLRTENKLIEKKIEFVYSK